MSAKRKILGERLEPEQLSENTSEHLHRYALALQFCENKAVLDIASGEGYGSNLLAKKARLVAGVDIDNETILRAKEKYKQANLEFKTGSADKIPYPDHSFDVVISFETLEHHDRHEEMMAEVKRVLKPGGLCVISTPDKLVYSDKKNYKNPFHVKELYKEEFRGLLKKYFSGVSIFRQQFFSGSLIVPDKSNANDLKYYRGDFNAVNINNEIESEYLLGFASDAAFAFDESSLFLDEDFANNKVLQFKNSSRRYKLGFFILNPLKYLGLKK
ncbi:MAG: class I SAM-dependent methyltransferase [Ferruginibacter sp.]